MQIFQVPTDLWIELIVENDFSDWDLLNFCLSCKFFSRLLSHEKIKSFIQSRNIYFGAYPTAEPTSAENKEKALKAVAWNADGRFLAVIDTREIEIWSTRTARIKRKLEDLSCALICFHRNKPNILASTSHDVIHIWDISNGLQNLELNSHYGLINSIDFHPQEDLLASAGNDKQIRIWNAITGTRGKFLNGSPKAVLDVKFTPDGNTLVSSSTDGSIRTWDFRAGYEEQEINVFPRLVYFSFGLFDHFALASYRSQGLVKIYDIETGLSVAELSCKCSKLSQRVLIHPSGKYYILYGLDGAELWETESHSLVVQFFGTIVKSCAFSPNGSAIVLLSPSNPSPLVYQFSLFL